MTYCPEHAELMQNIASVAASLKALHEDIREVKADLKATNRTLRREVDALMQANGARREAIGELRGRIITIASLLAVAVSAAVSLAIRMLT